MYENKLEFPGGRGGAKQKTFRGGSMDIFWNCTMTNYQSWSSSCFLTLSGWAFNSSFSLPTFPCPASLTIMDPMSLELLIRRWSIKDLSDSSTIKRIHLCLSHLTSMLKPVSFVLKWSTLWVCQCLYFFPEIIWMLRLKDLVQKGYTRRTCPLPSYAMSILHHILQLR